MSTNRRPDEPRHDGAEGGAGASEPSTLSLLDTHQLIARAQAGDDHAISTLYERYIRRVSAWLRGRVPDHSRGLHDTAGLSHEVLVKTLLHAVENRVHMRASFRAYLRRAVENRLIDLHRSSRLRNDELPEQILDAAPTVEEVMIAEAFEARVLAALRKLDGEQQRLISLRFEREASFAEIASELGLASADAARMRVQRTLEGLRQTLAKDLDA